VWLIFTAFLFSRAVTQTGFGMRVGYLFIERFGGLPCVWVFPGRRRTCVAPFIRRTRRAVAADIPITRSVLRFGFGARADGGKMGSFLMLGRSHHYGRVRRCSLPGWGEPADRGVRAQDRHVDLSGAVAVGSIVPGFLTWRSCRGCCAAGSARDSAYERRRAMARQNWRGGVPWSEEKGWWPFMFGRDGGPG